MRNIIKEWGIVFVIAAFIGGFVLPAMAAGVLGQTSATSDRNTPIISGLMNAVGNYPSSGGYSNPNGKSNWIDCSIVATGTNDMSFNIQTSRGGGVAWVNALSTPWVVTPGNSETLHFFGRVIGSNEIRFRTADSDVDVTNTATFTCDFWR